MNSLFVFSHNYLTVWATIMENERFMITIYLFLFPLGFEDYNMNIRDLSNSNKRSIVSSFLSRDYLVLWTTIMVRERFMSTIYVFLLALVMRDFSMNTKDLSTLYKRSMVSSSSPVIS